MMRTKCKEFRCKHNRSEVCALDGGVEIGASGNCASFEKGIFYYFNLVWNALSRKNFIDMIELDNELRIGLYYVMSVFHIGFSEMEWGTCRMLVLKNGEDGPALKYEDIIALPVDKAALQKLYDEFNAGKLPGADVEKKAPPKKSQPFGWLSPLGVFTEADMAEHEEAAHQIIVAGGFEEEYKAWFPGTGRTSRDFLSEIKGYCLIHNPSGSGGYIVSHRKALTKKQRDFLYGYFMDIGDRFKAEQFVKGGS